jgi:hypothetical protein
LSEKDLVQSSKVVTKVLDPLDDSVLATIAFDQDIEEDREEFAKTWDSLATNVASAINTVMLQRTLDALEKRTQEIRTVFSHISQGICILDDHLLISGEYSQSLESILDVRELHNKALLPILFEASEIKADIQSRVEQSLLSAIGDDRLAFELNSVHLIRSLSHVKNKVVQFLELDWTPLCNENDVVERVMVTIRDITVMKKMNEDAAKRDKVMGMTAEVATLAPDVFRKFILRTREDFNYCHSQIQKGEHILVDTAAEIKRLLHTIKGNSRTLRLSYLSAENMIWKTSFTKRFMTPAIPKDSPFRLI